MGKINVAELLKDCPKGMELDCTMWDGVTFEEIQPGNYPIKVKIKGDEDITTDFTEFGEWNYLKNSKCVIFPTGKTTWEGFVPPRKFKDGDIVITTLGNTAIIKEPAAIEYFAHCILVGAHLHTVSVIVGVERLATEEEKQELLDAIKAHGYKWNEETKTLEELIEPKFKVGNKIKEINSNEYVVLITDITDDYYIGETEYCMKVAISMNMQNNYELVPNKFDITTLVPFESKVLVRESKTDAWEPAFYGFFHQRYKRFYTTSSTWLMCIPYNEDTKHLIGTTNDCDEFYKTWEERA